MSAGTMTREDFVAQLEGGAEIKDLIEKGGVPRSTAYKWRDAAGMSKRASEPPKNGAQAVDPVNVEPFDPDRPEPRARNVTPQRGGGSRSRSGAITEKTAGQILAFLFFVIYLMTSEPLWQLTDDERDQLAEPLAESCANLPAPIAKAVNQYAAPGVFFGALAGVVMAKNEQIKNKGRQPASRPSTQGAERRPPAPPPPRPTIPTPDPEAVARAAQQIRNGHVADPNLVTTGTMEPDGTIDGAFRG